MEIMEFKYKEIKGDLFSCPPSNSLAHCISEDCRMGKGIAALFKRKFGGVEDLIKQGKKPGDVAVLKRNQRFVYYLITKAKYWQKPNYLTLKLSLIAMKKHCVENKVTELSMPKIGTGLDRLEWFKVSQIIQEVFKDTSITVNIYSI